MEQKRPDPKEDICLIPFMQASEIGDAASVTSGKLPGGNCAWETAWAAGGRGGASLEAGDVPCPDLGAPPRVPSACENLSSVH